MTATAQFRARDVTAALRKTLGCGGVRSETTPGGTVFVTVTALAARYLGVGWDDQAAADRIGYHLHRPVAIVSHSGWNNPGQDPMVTFRLEAAPAGTPLPPPPGGSDAVRSYASAAEALRGMPADRAMTGLVRLAIEAGCRPHLFDRSPHGRQYRLSLWHVDGNLLHGCIDASEVTGKFAAGWLQWGRGPERKTTDIAKVRAALTSCRDLHHGPAKGPRATRGSRS